jgi:hypothetical protein
VHPNDPNLFNPIHEDDIIASVPALLGAATVPATIVNWGGDEQVSLLTWSRYLGELVGREPRLVETEASIGGVTVDLTRFHEIAGPTTVTWRDGMRRMVAARHPELLVD